ncbi:hypothetical protein ACJJTC_007497 [Scirpophaga incertulas]
MRSANFEVMFVSKGYKVRWLDGTVTELCFGRDVEIARVIPQARWHPSLTFERRNSTIVVSRKSEMIADGSLATNEHRRRREVIKTRLDLKMRGGILLWQDSHNVYDVDQTGGGVRGRWEAGIGLSRQLLSGGMHLRAERMVQWALGAFSMSVLIETP